MTKFEKWKDEIADISNVNRSVAVVNGKPAICQTIDCKSCDFKGNVNCYYELLKWAASEYEESAPKLTKREREFLECFLNTSKRTISRDLTSGLLGFGYNGNWCDRLKEDIFQFIKKGECWVFEDLLKLEVEE